MRAKHPPSIYECQLFSYIFVGISAGFFLRKEFLNAKTFLLILNIVNCDKEEKDHNKWLTGFAELY